MTAYGAVPGGTGSCTEQSTVRETSAEQGKTQQRNWTNLIEYLGAHDVFNAFWTAFMHANPQTIAIRADHLRE